MNYAMYQTVQLENAININESIDYLANWEMSISGFLLERWNKSILVERSLPTITFNMRIATLANPTGRHKHYCYHHHPHCL